MHNDEKYKESKQALTEICQMHKKKKKVHERKNKFKQQRKQRQTKIHFILRNQINDLRPSRLKIISRSRILKLFFCGVQNSKLKPCIYHTLSSSTKLNS